MAVNQTWYPKGIKDANVGEGFRIAFDDIYALQRQLQTLISQQQTTAGATKTTTITVTGGGTSSGLIRVSFGYSSVTAALSSPHVRVPQVSKSGGGFLGFQPLFLDVNAVGAPGGAGFKFDIQTSPNDSTWTSILASPPAILGAGSNFAPTLTSGAFVPGVKLTANYWVRALVEGGSDLAATVIQIELGVVGV